MVTNHCPEIAAEMAAINENNQHCDELAKILNEPYDCQTWNNLRTNTNLFKLSWKQEFVREVSGKPTFYGKLIDGELPGNND